MDILKRLIQTFTYIAAGSMISAALFITIFIPKTELDVSILWEIIAMSAICSLGNFFYYLKKIVTKKQIMLRIAFHYLYINLVVFSGGYLWEWLTPGLIPEFLVMLLLITTVYAIVMIAVFHQEEKMAEKFNRQLRKYYPEQGEGEDS